jgi:hypothetical protein
MVKKMTENQTLPEKIYLIEDLWYDFHRVKKNAVLILDIAGQGGKQEQERINYCVMYFKDFHRKIKNGIINPNGFISRNVDKLWIPASGKSEEKHGKVLEAMQELIEKLEHIGEHDGEKIDINSSIQSLRTILNVFL